MAGEPGVSAPGFSTGNPGADLPARRSARSRAFRSVCEFVGVETAVVPPSVGSVLNRSTRLRSRRIRESMLLNRAWKVLPKRLVYWLDSLNRTEAASPEVSPALRGRLLEYFRASTDAVESRLDRALPGWRV